MQRSFKNRIPVFNYVVSKSQFSILQVHTPPKQNNTVQNFKKNS